MEDIDKIIGGGVEWLVEKCKPCNQRNLRKDRGMTLIRDTYRENSNRKE